MAVLSIDGVCSLYTVGALISTPDVKNTRIYREFPASVIYYHIIYEKCQEIVCIFITLYRIIYKKCDQLSRNLHIF